MPLSVWRKCIFQKPVRPWPDRANFFFGRGLDLASGANSGLVVRGSRRGSSHRACLVAVRHVAVLVSTETTCQSIAHSLSINYNASFKWGPSVELEVMFASQIDV